MKVTIKYFFIFIAISGCYSNHPGNSAKKLTKQDEVLKIMRDHTISNLENSKFIDVTERKELRKMKNDYYYVCNPDLSLTIPGVGWEIRGPMTIAQIEQESLEEMRQIPNAPQVPFGFRNDEWNELKSKYKDGDEIYYYKSDKLSWVYLRGREGYVIIRDKKVLGGIVIAFS